MTSFLQQQCLHTAYRTSRAGCVHIIHIYVKNREIFVYTYFCVDNDE